MKHRLLAALVTATCIMPAVPAFAEATARRHTAETARDMYHRAMAQERALREDSNKPTATEIRHVVASYERIVRKHPASGYCDDALWQGGNLAALAHQRFGNEADRKTAARLFTLLAREYPTSKFVPRAREALAGLSASGAAAPAPVAAAIATAKPVGPATPKPAALSRPSETTPAAGPAVLKEINRTVLADGIRLTVDFDAEITYHQEEIDNPRRLFFDLKGVRAAPSLQDVSLKFDDDVVKEVRLGRHPQTTPTAASKAVAPPIAAPPPIATPARTMAPLAALPQVKQTEPETRPAVFETPLPSEPAGPRSLPPVAPAANSNGKFSLARQLGLNVSRIVIDAGHGGHDPGARGNGVNEAELTLDVALRVQKLLIKQPGVEVVMTRDSDVFIPLQERTAIANREGADLFLSIHANASRNGQARGIETYFLNFAMNPEAEAVAARENATSGQAMHSLPDIVRAIALNNKINESRDLAATVQRSMAKRLSAKNRTLRDLGVKQAPFVVLIGAAMPSVLAEISFVTNKQESALLRTQAYRQQIAQALFDAILNYQQGLKRMNAVAGKKATS